MDSRMIEMIKPYLQSRWSEWKVESGAMSE